MSLIHLLFPPGELEILDHAWNVEALSTSKVNSEESQSGWRNLEPPSKRQYTGYSRQRNLHGYPEHISTWRTNHFHSKTQSRPLREHRPSIQRNFKEPTVPHHRGHRYPISPSYWPEAQLQESTPHNVGEFTISPCMINADWDSPSPDGSIEIPSTPSSVCDQFRSGPFGHIFDGLLLTDQERDLLEELAQPDATESPDQNRRAPTAAEIVQTLSQMTYADFINQSPDPGSDPGGQMNDDRSSIALEPVPVGEDDDRAERERDNSIHDETKPPIMQQRTVPDANDIISEKDQILCTG